MGVKQTKRHSYEIVYTQDGSRFVTSENYIDIKVCLDAFNKSNKLRDKTLIGIQENIIETIFIPITE